MTEREKQLRRSDRLRIGAILALCLILAVPVMVAMAASPDPSASTEAAPSTSASVAPAASAEAPAASAETPAAPKPTDKASTDGQKGDRKGDRGGSGHGAVTITAINGSKLSLKTEDGWTRTITVTADTKIRKGGQDIAVGDLEVGDTIRFGQKRNDDGTYTITSISVPTPKTGGEVTAVSGDSLTLKRRNGETQTVKLTSSTTYKVGRTEGTRADVTVGSKVTVQGETSGSTFTALTVNVAPTVVGGEVTAKTKDSLTLKQRDGSSVVVHVSSDTKFLVRGNKTAGLADLAVGDVAIATGTTRADGSLDAAGVGKGWSKGDHRDKGPKTDDSTKSPAPSTTPG